MRNDTDLILKNKTPILKYCNLKQALDWVVFGLLPISKNNDRHLRNNKNNYNGYYNSPNNDFYETEKTQNEIDNAKKEVMALVLSNSIKTIAFTGKTTVSSFEYIENSYIFNKETMLAFNFDFDRNSFNGIDWQESVFFDFKETEDDLFDIKLKAKGDVEHFSEVEGYPDKHSTIFASLYIEINFKELKEKFPYSRNKPVDYNNTQIESKKYKIDYENNTIYLITDYIKLKIKTLKDGKQKKVFEYIFNNQNKDITKSSMKSLIILDEIDRLDQYMRNVFRNNTDLMSLLFKKLKTNLIVFNAEFTSEDIKERGLEKLEV